MHDDRQSPSVCDLVARRRAILALLAWPATAPWGCAATDTNTVRDVTGVRSIALPDGRTVEVWLGGDPPGHALVMHHGTPSDATTFDDWDAACRARGMRLICISRPGYAGSTRRPGRTVAQVSDDVAAVLDALGHRRFVTAGWSGGGPHALACAARLPGRCQAAATLAGVGPSGASDLDFLAGMGEENVAEFGAARAGEAALRRWLADNAEALRQVTGPELAAALGDLVAPADKAVLVGGYADHMAAVFRRAVAPGFDGWVDDDLAFVRDWGFNLDDVRVPVAVWQGELDRMVPFAHGRWLARHVPGAQPHLVAEHGHLSLVVRHRDAVLDQLLAQARVSS